MSSGNRRRSTSQRDVPSSSRAIAHPNMDIDDYLHPGPIDPSLLTMQNEHRTEAIWRNQMDRTFKSVKPLKVMGHNVVTMKPRLLEYVANAGFLPWTKVCNVKADPKLCTALVERWRPETHTFHLNGGEATITLQDVALLTGLPIDGQSVSGFGELEWEPLCLSLLGDVPDRPKLKSMGSKTWFDDYLNTMPDDVDEETLKKYARAYILCLLGLTLMSDLYGDQVSLHYLPLLADLENASRYSWESAVLAYQYSQLCRASHYKKSQIGGCPLLLQFWCWERIRIARPQEYIRYPPDLDEDIHPYFRPCWSYLHWAGPKHFEEVPRGSLVFYRDQLERMVEGDFIYRPYEEELMERLHPLCLESRELWATDVPLICFNIIEWHHPIRVMRQFGWKQIIPPVPIAFTNEHHGLERKKRVDWRVYLSQYGELWNNRWERRTFGDPSEDGEDIDIPSDEYVYWYSRITRRLIQPRLEEEDTQAYRPSAHELPSNIRTLLICASQAAEGFNSTADSQPIFHRIFHTAVDELRLLGELRLLNIDPDSIQFGNGADDDMSVDDDHVTNLHSQTPDYDRPSGSREPPSPPSRPSTSQAPHSPPGHVHNLRPEKTPKQSWLQKIQQRRRRKD